ncbi:hypothetical protein OESDEN_08357 [Oesophagostomum dentatum]|uniref:Amino acid transporter transmembrane domain-containing protein n=1 Tax=Oesophagostomum dentatum TaxID=61180 RepID=A0A0B1T7J4_OESDE|nr:hypothetical protein OESDEN_08357 [Oesophagostomum dentatum]
MLLLTNYCGYLIQHYPVYEMLWPSVQSRLNEANNSATVFMDFALRYAVVVLSFGLAYVIPNFKDIVPFVGVTTGMMLALFFPPLLETVAFYDCWKKSSLFTFIFNVALNVFYISLGILFMIVGVYSNYQVLSKQNRP